MTAEDDAVGWLDQYGDALYRFARARVGDSFTAEDLLQETLLAAYRSRDKFSGNSSVSTWLTGILKHKIADYYRKIRPETGDEFIDEFAAVTDAQFDVREKWKVKPGDWGGDPKEAYENKELMAHIHSCLDGMPERMSSAYRLREMEGAATSEISALLQTGGNNCLVILHRARMLLRRCLEVNWVGGRE